MKPWLPALIPACALVLAGCGAVDAGEPVQLPTTQACFVSGASGFPVSLEVASDNAARQKGLMGRKELAENAGMLFQYQEQRPASYGFWMFKTLIPLDIAYLDDQGVIVSMRHMHPCASSRGTDCPSYPAGEPFWNAVEMKAGYFADRGISPGDRLAWPATDCPP
ncbi:MAG TPA: DUF192 domain-containing protein [Marinobacter sp.]|nr:DUF192 domain-containing protein [Marinobacter sp.]